MKKIKYFHLSSCPYCIQANLWIDQLLEEFPHFKAAEIERIEEVKQSHIADQYDYYYVPCFYIDEVKAHEGVATKDKIKAVLEKALHA